MDSRPLLIIHGIAGGIGSELYKLAAMDDRFILFGTERKDIDFGDPASVERFYTNLDGIDARGPGGPVYVVNATGACESSLLAKTTTDSYVRQRTSLLDGNFYLARAFAQAARTRPGSSLLLLSSVVKRRRVPGTVVYAMCKAGLDGLVQATASEIGRYGSRINAIEMGYFDTGMIRLVPEEYQEQLKKETPMGRLGRTEELWSICWETLNNYFVTGATMSVTGGL